MTQIARLIGGAGTGKTTELLRLLEMNLQRGLDPLQIGFVSFTRAARATAATRAAELCNCSSAQLEAEGWFRTLHSVCFRVLGISKGTVLAEDRSASKWMQENLGESIGVALGSDEDLAEADFATTSDTGRALQLWHAARNRLEPLSVAWQYASAVSDRTPAYEACVDVVTRYEQAKRLDGKQDFTDILGSFAGWYFGIDGHERCTPDGDSPNLPVWFFDEQQDTSALLDSVCKRLICSAEYAYVVGDFFQSIYTWAGADARLFLAWEVARERTMPKSYRCPKPIHEFGESILREASDYWDRGIASADHEGSVDIERFSESLLADINPAESWLVLARTNYHANRLAQKLRELDYPWQPTRGAGGWNKPATNKGLQGLLDAQNGLPIEAGDWEQIIKLLPVKCDRGELLVRGTKTNFEPSKHKHEGLYFQQLTAWGATELLVGMIASGDWQGLIEGARVYAQAVSRYGWQVVNNPPVRVGTIHSVKGAEADNVLWLTSGTKATSKACEEQRGYDDECKVAYVAATRARKRLIVAVEPNERHRFRIPAA